MNNQRPRGFVIVGTVLVLCVVIIVLAGATALRLIHQAGQDVEIQAYAEAQRLSEGCMETALQRIRESATYAGNETVAVGGNTCTIKPIIAGATTTIQTEATVDGHPYRNQVTLDNVATVHITSWSHVIDF